MKLTTPIFIIFALLVAGPAMAAEKVEPAVNASNKAAFDTVSTWVQQQMQGTGRYSCITASERAKVTAKLDEMGKLLGAKGDVASMSDAEKLKMFNDQEEVNAILAKRDNDRLVCKNENPIGSHIPVRTCQTAGEIEARRRNDRQYLQRHEATQQIKSG